MVSWALGSPKVKAAPTLRAGTAFELPILLWTPQRLLAACPSQGPPVGGLSPCVAALDHRTRLGYFALSCCHSLDLLLVSDLPRADGRLRLAVSERSEAGHTCATEGEQGDTEQQDAGDIDQRDQVVDRAGTGE